MYSATADMKGSTNIGGMIPLEDKNMYGRVEITPEIVENLGRVEIPLKELLINNESNLTKALERRGITRQQVVDVYQTINRMTYTIVYKIVKEAENIYARIEITPESIEEAKDSSILQVLQEAMREEEADFKKHLTAYLFGDAIKQEDLKGWKRIKWKASDFLKLILSVFRFKR